MSWSWLSDIGDSLSSVLGSGATGAAQAASGGGFWSGVGDVLSNPSFISSALQSATGLASGLYSQKAEKDSANQAQQYELEKLKLQAQFGLLGNKGGGGGSSKESLLYKAYQDYLNNQTVAREGVSSALTGLGNAAARPLLR